MVMSIKPWITLTKMAKRDHEEINNQIFISYLTFTSFLSHTGGLSARENRSKWIQAVVSEAARGRVTSHISSYVRWRESSGKVTQNGSLNVPVASYHTEDCWVLTSPFSKGRSPTGNVPLRFWLLHVIGWACTEGREAVPCPFWQTLGGFKKTTTGTEWKNPFVIQILTKHMEVKDDCLILFTAVLNN